jgi:molybdenum cofactor biosynthesis enzyme MoaA
VNKDRDKIIDSITEAVKMAKAAGLTSEEMSVVIYENVFRDEIEKIQDYFTRLAYTGRTRKSESH